MRPGPPGNPAVSLWYAMPAALGAAAAMRRVTFSSSISLRAIPAIRVRSRRAAGRTSIDYRYQRPSRDGIGKVYLGREIS